MPDKYNFSKHLSEIIRPVLKPIGFKKKGSNFTKETDGSTFAFEISRSSWNGLPDRPDQLNLDIRVVSNNLNSTIILHRPTNEKFPNYYAPFFQDKLDWSEKSRLMQSFSEMEIKEIDKYLDSISWKYGNEEELIILVQELLNQIIKVGIPTIHMAENLIHKGLDSLDFSSEMRKYSNRIFLSQLDIDSRFPED